MRKAFKSCSSLIPKTSKNNKKADKLSNKFTPNSVKQVPQTFYSKLNAFYSAKPYFVKNISIPWSGPTKC